MRMARDHRENEVRAPLLEALRECQAHAAMLRLQWERLNKFFARGLQQPIMDKIGHDIARTLSKAIREACIKIRHPAEDAILIIPVHELTMANPGSPEKRVLEAWLEQSLHKLQIRAPLGGSMPDGEIKFVEFDISIPSLGYRHSEEMR